MKKLVLVAALAAFVAPMGAETVMAGPIDRACMKSDRKARTSRLCGCLQFVADKTLDRSDQRMAAKFFKKPQMAQDIRQSDKPSHEVFWRKYKAFGATAESVCARV